VEEPEQITPHDLDFQQRSCRDFRNLMKHWQPSTRQLMESPTWQVWVSSDGEDSCIRVHIRNRLTNPKKYRYTLKKLYDWTS